MKFPKDRLHNNIALHHRPEKRHFLVKVIKSGFTSHYGIWPAADDATRLLLPSIANLQNSRYVTPL